MCSQKLNIRKLNIQLNKKKGPEYKCAFRAINYIKSNRVSFINDVTQVGGGVYGFVIATMKIQ